MEVQNDALVVPLEFELDLDFDLANDLEMEEAQARDGNETDDA